jgi:IS66 C-terminal element
VPCRNPLGLDGGRAFDGVDRAHEPDQGGVHWGVIAPLIETCKLNAVDAQVYLTDVLRRLVNRHPARQIDQLVPWAYANRVA